MSDLANLEPWIRVGAFVAVFLPLAALESRAPRRRPGIPRQWRWAQNLGLLLVGTLLLRAVFPLAAVGAAVLARSAGWGAFNAVVAPPALGIVVSVLALDFAVWAQHRLFHHLPLLWRLHRVHHADLDFDLTTGLRFHPLELLLSMLLKVAVAIALGAPPLAVLGFEVLLNATALFSHANLRLAPRLDGVLRSCLVTPDMHRVHHSVDPLETDRNFGFALSWWDRLAGTYLAQPRLGHEAMGLGLREFRDARHQRLDQLLLLPFAHPRRAAHHPPTAVAAGCRGSAREESMSTEPLVHPDGTYACVPLAKDEISLCVVQSRVRAVDAANRDASVRDNLEHMLGLIDAANGWLGPKDIVFFHEFPITGFNARWNRADLLKVAIEIPGPETEAIAARAKRYGCYVVFGSYARDRDWPNHVLSITTIIDPRGEVVGRHWKARNIKGLFGRFEVFTTTIYDVLDEYVEKYGRDEVVPVTRTPVGNLCTTSTQLEPEIIRAFALRGGEIMLRTATGGFDEFDIQANARYNNMYTAIVNQAISRDNPGSFEDVRSGGSAIYGPDGAPLARANSVNEGPVLARIPIRAFRERRRIPNVHASLYRDLYAQYVEAYPPNLFSAYQPSDGVDSARYLADKRRWK